MATGGHGIDYYKREFAPLVVPHLLVPRPQSPANRPKGCSRIFLVVGGKTWEISTEGRYQTTLSGDGVVAYRESVLL